MTPTFTTRHCCCPRGACVVEPPDPCAFEQQYAAAVANFKKHVVANCKKRGCTHAACAWSPKKLQHGGTMLGHVLDVAYGVGRSDGPRRTLNKRLKAADPSSRGIQQMVRRTVGARAVLARLAAAGRGRDLLNAIALLRACVVGQRKGKMRSLSAALEAAKARTSHTALDAAAAAAVHAVGAAPGQ